MTLSIQIFLLIFARVMGAVGTAPLFGHPQVPAVWKIGFSFFLAVIVASAMKLQGGAVAALQHAPLVQLIVPLAVQSLVGAAIGLCGSVVFAAVQFSGELLDIQIGFSLAQLLSPGMTGSSGLIANFQYLLFSLWFLSVNGHFALVLAFLDSFQAVPLAASMKTEPLAVIFLHQIVELFIVGMQLAAPVMLALFLTNISLAIASRAMPQMNVFVVGMPAALLVGLALLVVVLPAMGNLFGGLLTQMEQAITQVFYGLGGRV